MKTTDVVPSYPIISWPADGVEKMPPQPGCSDICGYSDHFFCKILSNSELGPLLQKGCHLDVPCRPIPYQPAIVLADEGAGWFIDIEIDSPYHGWYRIPQHDIDGKDNVRDDYFSRCGWTVVRFSERQVRQETESCVEFIRMVIRRLRGDDVVLDGIVPKDKRWTFKEAVELEKNLFREKSLQIQTFGRPIWLDTLYQLMDTGRVTKQPSQRSEIVFNEATHVYSDARNQTGTADYISVTTLIDKFFPFFDEGAYIEKFMKESGKSRDEVVRKMMEPSERGTEMHQQIEYYLKGKPHREDFKEFQLFLKFHEEQILKRGLTFSDAEKVVILPQYGIAGTVDALFRKPDGTYVMVDWKRSKNLIIDGYTKKYGYGRGISILSHLDNSSYYHYELQQSFYKYILENEYGMKISSMILCVLHPDYDRYYTIKLSDYRIQEVRDMIVAHVLIDN